MSEPSDDKIELLVRSVLAAVDARLAEIRSEIKAVASDVGQRHQQVLTKIQDIEDRWAADTGHGVVGADPLAARMEQATQVLLERIEAMHQRNTMATNERFALINNALEQLSVDSLVPTAMVPMPSLDAMNEPLRVGPPTGQVPVAAHVTAFDSPLPRPLLTIPPANQPQGDGSQPIDMTQLADLLSERLAHISLPLHEN